MAMDPFATALDANQSLFLMPLFKDLRNGEEDNMWARWRASYHKRVKSRGVVMCVVVPICYFFSSISPPSRSPPGPDLLHFGWQCNFS
jgi:hypothetical protein